MLYVFSTELYHHGIKGQRWGIRRYQNPDGTYTEAGLKRLHKKDVRWAKRNYNKLYKTTYKKSKKEMKKFVKVIQTVDPMVSMDDIFMD